MEYYLKDKKVNLIINKKFNKNGLTLKIDEDLNIVVNCNFFLSQKYIYDFIDKNQDKILRMLNQKEEDKDYYFLGKKYEKIDN